MSYRPAYSTQFAPENVAVIKPVQVFGTITREWAWGGSTGKGVKVAIIDSGVDTTHPALGELPVSEYVSITEQNGEIVYDKAPHEDAYGHGTACAGIIRSFAPECEIYSVKVLGTALTGRGVVFAAGLQWAIENGMHVCNLSLGTTRKDFYTTLHELADLAYFRNIPLITAANNMSTPSYPSMFASVISVASHEVKDPYHFYYNPNPPVEFGALGIDIEVAWLNGGWLTATGNSFAAPHMTGIVTKILAKHPGLTVFQLKAILRELASNVEARAKK